MIDRLKKSAVDISYLTQERRRTLVEYFGLMDDFKASMYSSYGWYLKSKGVTVSGNTIMISPFSPLRDEPSSEDKIFHLIEEGLARFEG